MNRTIRRFGLTALAIVAGSGIYAYAQSSTTGSLSGVVKDASGAHVAGATVTASSAQVSRSVVTASDGSYRIGLLNPGSWTIKVTKGTLSSSSQRVTVLLNAPTTANFQISEASASVVVVAAAAQLDATTTQSGQIFQLDSLSAIPKGRDFNSLAILAPGTQTSSLGTSISGASGIENNFLVDGLDTTDYRKGFQGASMPTDFFDQVEIQTGGFRPEFSALGGVVNAITKSGTNEFIGSTWMTSDMPQNQGVPKQNLYYRQTPARNRYDVGFTAGGAIVRDKLFYFIGFNQINLEDNAGAILANRIGLKNSVQTDKTTNVYLKANYFISQDQQITLTVNSVNEPIDAKNIYPNIGNRDTGLKQTNKTLNWYANYDWTVSPNVLFSLKFGSTDVKTTNTPTVIAPSISDQMWFKTGPGTGDTRFLTTDYFTHGGSGDWTALDNGSSTQIKADLSWFAGNHSMKFGISQTSTKSKIVDLLAADDRVSIVQETRAGHSHPGELRYISVTTYANLGSEASVKYNAVYAQDQWEVTPGFRLAYGFRLETQEVKGNDGKTFVKFTDTMDQLQPRLGFTWDVNNDGKTKISANYAVYQERVPMQPALRTAGNETYIQKVYYGYLTGKAHYNSADGSYSYTGAPDAVADYSGYFRDYPQDTLDPLKVPKRAEYLLGIDRTLANGWTVGAHLKYREMLRIVEDTVPTDADGVPIDGEGFSILWNPKAGRTYRWLNNKYHSNPGGVNVWTNTEFPTPQNIYQGADVTLDRKTDKYVFSFSYTLSRTYGNYEGLGQTSNGQADGNITSTWDYYPYVGTGPLPLDRTNQIKMFGSYNFDLGGNVFAIGGRASYMSGTPKSYFDATNDLGGYGNASPEFGQYGTRGTLPAQLTVDMHLEYNHKFGKRIKLMPTFDIFNLFNKRTQTNWDQYGTTRTGSENPSFGYESAWLAGRSYRWGVKLQF